MTGTSRGADEYAILGSGGYCLCGILRVVAGIEGEQEVTASLWLVLLLVVFCGLIEIAYAGDDDDR